MEDRQTAMVKLYGETCFKTQAARILHVSTEKIRNMLEDGRLTPACAGTRVDVRSIADYIQAPTECEHQARRKRSGQKWRVD